MNDINRNDKSKTPQSTTPAGKDSVQQQGKDARSTTTGDNKSQQTVGKDAKGSESPSKS